MCLVPFGSKAVDRKVVDTDKPDSVTHEELPGLRFEIDELFEESAVVPVRRIVGLEKNALDAGPVQVFEVAACDGPNARDLHDCGGSHKDLQRHLAQRLSALHEMCWCVDVG